MGKYANCVVKASTKGYGGCTKKQSLPKELTPAQLKERAGAPRKGSLTTTVIRSIAACVEGVSAYSIQVAQNPNIGLPERIHLLSTHIVRMSNLQPSAKAKEKFLTDLRLHFFVSEAEALGNEDKIEWVIAKAAFTDED